MSVFRRFGCSQGSHEAIDRYFATSRDIARHRAVKRGGRNPCAALLRLSQRFVGESLAVANIEDAAFWSHVNRIAALGLRGGRP